MIIDQDTDIAPPELRRQTDMGWGPRYGPFSYTLLPEPTLSNELARLAGSTSYPGNIDAVSFQPCPNPAEFTQDRYVVQKWKFGDGEWTMIGVFDGHAGHETVDHILSRLPPLIHSSLASALSSSPAPPPETISHLLTDAIRSVDLSITRDFLDLFPGGPEVISKLSLDEIKAVIADPDDKDKLELRAVRCMRGSTALVSLTDPGSNNLWVASLGDCQAVLGQRAPDNVNWNVAILSSNHNGRNEAEANRVRSEHVGEPECILRDRVLGSLALTRALGDIEFKIPAIYTDRVLRHTRPGWRIQTPLSELIPRILTPPYVSNLADVRHVDLPSQRALCPSELFLILASDGLVDLYDIQRGMHMDVARAWVEVVGEAEGRGNRALALLREAIGGDDRERVSRMLKVEMFHRWMDDTTILVQTL